MLQYRFDSLQVKFRTLKTYEILKKNSSLGKDLGPTIEVKKYAKADNKDFDSGNTRKMCAKQDTNIF